MRKSNIASGFLVGVNAASLGLMLSVAIILGKTTLHNTSAWIIFLAATVIVIIKNINAVLIVLIAAVAGWLLSLII